MGARIKQDNFELVSFQGSIRVTHNRDIVPSVPPMWVGFHHVATEVWQVDFDVAHVSCHPVELLAMQLHRHAQVEATRFFSVLEACCCFREPRKKTGKVAVLQAVGVFQSLSLQAVRGFSRGCSLEVLAPTGGFVRRFLESATALGKTLCVTTASAF